MLSERIIRGKVVSGLRRGASFTQLEWAREAFIAQLGIDPFPGTLNVHLDDPVALQRWAGLMHEDHQRIKAGDEGFCDARAYPLRLAGRFPGAAIVPEVAGYPDDQIEIIAALNLRQSLSLNDGDGISLEPAARLAVNTVIFDVDGTLVNSIEGFRIVAQLAADEFGLQVTRAAVLHSLNTNTPFWESIVPQTLSGRTGIVRDIRRAAMRHWSSVLHEHVELFPDLGPMLETLRAQGLRLGIVTGSDGASLKPLESSGLIDHFTAVITATDVERRKPDPEGLLRCLALLESEPHQAVYVGDTPLDIQTSRAAGTAAVAVLSGAGDSALLSVEGPEWIISGHRLLPAVLAPPRE